MKKNDMYIHTTTKIPVVLVSIGKSKVKARYVGSGIVFTSSRAYFEEHYRKKGKWKKNSKRVIF